MGKELKPEEMFEFASAALSIEYFGDKIEFNTSIKEIASKAGVTEEELRSWMDRLEKGGIEFFSHLKPGRRKKDLSSLEKSKQLDIHERVRRLLLMMRKDLGKNHKFSPEFKERVLRGRERLKKQASISDEHFAELLEIDPATIELWARKFKEEGREGLRDESCAREP